MTITTIVTQQQTGIEVFGKRDDLRELDQRLALMLPGKLNKNERLALAQAAIAHNLDPFNGEIWMIPNRGLMVGVKGLRKKAREQINNKGNFWIDFRAIDNVDERKTLQINDGSLAYEARLFDTENVLTYTGLVERMLKAGMPWEVVKSMIGDKPYTVGIGEFKRGESTKMTPAQCAMKRAEADALKRRFDVPFGLAIADATDEEIPFAGAWELEGSEAIEHDAEKETYTAALFYADAKAWGFAKEQADEFMNEAGALPEVAKSLAEKQYHADRLAKGKKQLGRDDTGLA